MNQFSEYKKATVGENTTPCQITELNGENVITYITEWLSRYSYKTNTTGYVIGVSGGVDSAVVSTLCVRTGLPVILVQLPIHLHKGDVSLEASNQYRRAKEHIEWLKTLSPNVTSLEVDLTDTYNGLNSMLRLDGVYEGKFNFTMANTASRLRMTTLYSIAGQKDMLVCGTGNRVEDFGVGFFSKWGDGAVDVSPIGDLMKTEVYVLAKLLGVNDSILNAKPTDGLHEDGRTDETQLGATYPELEWAMEYVDEYTVDGEFDDREVFMLNEREKEVLAIYLSFNRRNKHKMEPIPVCGIPADIL